MSAAPEPGDVIQVTDESHPWYLAILVIEDLKSYGCKAYQHVPHRDPRKPCFRRPIFLNAPAYEVIGKAVIFERGDDDEEA